MRIPLLPHGYALQSLMSVNAFPLIRTRWADGRTDGWKEGWLMIPSISTCCRALMS